MSVGFLFVVKTRPSFGKIWNVEERLDLSSETCDVRRVSRGCVTELGVYLHFTAADAHRVQTGTLETPALHPDFPKGVVLPPILTQC